MSELLYKAAYFIQNKFGFEEWTWKKNIDVVIPELGTVRVIDVIVDTRNNDNYSYGEYNQGSTAPGGIRFKVMSPDGEVIYLQKDGEYDSYGEVAYTGKLREVKPVEKTIVVYDFA